MKKCLLVVELTAILSVGSLGVHLHPSKISESNETEYFQYVLLDSKEDPCNRECTKGAPPMICKYQFILEWYDALSKACYDCPFNQDDCYREDCIPADGEKRPILVINRRMPGPDIQVCLGDELIVDVENTLVSETTTIHWHGQHQRNHPYMDGVPFVSQCPIQPQTTFRYQFKVETPGTHFWHSHIGMQRGDGVFGSMIVKVPKEDDPHADLYDYDLPAHVINLMDWDHQTGLHTFVSHHHNAGDNKPRNLLINGLGRFRYFEADRNDTAFIPTARFFIKQGFRYRFRIINAGFLNCPIEISIDNHTLNVISSDGSDIKRIEAQSLVTYAGERYDIVVHADQPEDVYWMRFGGLMDCDERFTSAHQVAVLNYEGIDRNLYPKDIVNYTTIHKEGIQVNSLNVGTESDSSIVSVPEFESLNKWDESLRKHPNFTYYISYDFYKINNPHFHRHPLYGFFNVTNTKQRVLTPQLNYISMKFLSFPLMSQREQITDHMLCNETTVKNCDVDYCECPHVIRVALNAIVELILIDKGFAYDANHPFHLHGHPFRVVAMERMGHNVTVEEVYKKDKMGLIKRNLKNPPLKDTVTVPDGGYTIIRFKADNPGYWLFHCHIEFHAEIGMALVFKVGEDKDMPPVPKNFPKCGNYYPQPDEQKSELPLCEKLTSLENLENYAPSLFGEKCRNFGNSQNAYTFLIHLMCYIVWAA